MQNQSTISKQVEQIKALVTKSASNESVKITIQEIVNGLSLSEREKIKTDFRKSFDFMNPAHVHIAKIKSLDDLIPRFASTTNDKIQNFMIKHALSLACNNIAIKDEKTPSTKKNSLEAEIHINEVKSRLEQGYSTIQEYLATVPKKLLEELDSEFSSTITDDKYDHLLSVYNPKELIEKTKSINPESEAYTFIIKRLIVLAHRSLINKEAKTENKEVLINPQLLTADLFDEYKKKMQELINSDTFKQCCAKGKAEFFISEIAKLPMLKRTHMDSMYSGSIDIDLELTETVRSKFNVDNIYQLLKNIESEKNPEQLKYKIKTAIVLAHRSLILHDDNLTSNQKYLFFRMIERNLNKAKAMVYQTPYEELPLENEYKIFNYDKDTSVADQVEVKPGSQIKINLSNNKSTFFNSYCKLGVGVAAGAAILASSIPIGLAAAGATCAAFYAASKCKGNKGR